MSNHAFPTMLRGLAGELPPFHFLTSVNRRLGAARAALYAAASTMDDLLDQLTPDTWETTALAAQYYRDGHRDGWLACQKVYGLTEEEDQSQGLGPEDLAADTNLLHGLSEVEALPREAGVADVARAAQRGGK